jgi:hypothetical protein
LNNEGDKSKKRIALVLRRNQFLTSWIDSGIVDNLINSQKFEVSVFAPQEVLDLLPEQTSYQKIRISSLDGSKASKHLIAMNWVALRHKSSTFVFSLQRTFKSDYWFWSRRLGVVAGVKQTLRNARTIAWNIRKKSLVVFYFVKPFRVFAQRYKKKLGKSEMLPSEIRQGNYEWLIMPSSAIDGITTDYIAEARAINLKSIVAIDNWDNLTSKSVYVVLPDYITVMGNRCVEHANRIHNFEAESVLTFGLPRFDAHRKHLMAGNGPRNNAKKRVLYAGFSLAHSEKRVVDAIADHLDNKFGPGSIEVHYRPHPIPIKRVDDYEIANKNVVVFEHQNLGRTGLPAMDEGFISAIDRADVVVGAPTTLMLEAMLLERPCLIDLTTDSYHRTTASIAAKHFLHMQDLISVPDLHIGYSIDDVLTKVDELLAIESESMKYDISHLYKTNDSLYSEQLLAFLSAER